MPSLFIPNPEFEAELLREREFQDAMREFAEAAAERSQQLVNAAHPGGAIMPRPGTHGNTIMVEDTPDGPAVVNTDYGAAITEFGSRRTPPEAPLRRGVQSAGLRLRGAGNP